MGVSFTDGESAPGLEAESELDDSEVTAAELSPATFFFAPVLKSVSYQPPPFNLKAAADTNLVSLDALHEGQIVKGPSEIFLKLF